MGRIKETGEYRSFVDITMPRSIIEASQHLCNSGFLDQLVPDLSVITPPLASQLPIMVLTSSPTPLPAAEASEPRLSTMQKRLLCLQECLMQSAPVRAPSAVPSAAPSDAARSAEVDKLATAADDKDEIEVAVVVEPTKAKGKGKHQASPLPQTQPPERIKADTILLQFGVPCNWCHANRAECSSQLSGGTRCACCSAPSKHYCCFWTHVNLNGSIKHLDTTNYLCEGGSVGVYHNGVGISFIDLPSLAPLVCLILVSHVLSFVEANPPIAWLDKESLEQCSAQLAFPSGLTVFPDLDRSGEFLMPYTRKAMAAAQLLPVTPGSDKLRRCLHWMFAKA